MPYISQFDRKKYDTSINELVEVLVGDSSTDEPGSIELGGLNYILSSLVWKLWGRSPCYRLANDLIGVLECVKTEFYRRHVAEYEEEAQAYNGDLETESGGRG